jgi:tRNA(Ile)-lysidine synthase
LQYCKEKNLSFVTDSTNADTAYARNRIRAEVVPALESLYGDIAYRSVHMSADLCEDDECLQQLAKEFVEENTTARGISYLHLQKAHPAIRRRALQIWFEKERGATLELVHLQALLYLIERADKTARVALPTGVSAYCTARGRLMLTKTKPQPVGEYTMPLTMGKTQIPNTDISICITPIENPDIPNKGDWNTLILAGEWKELQQTLTWRNRREGDVILRGKMHRQLRRLYAQKGIPTELRCALPLLCQGEEIVWAPFVGTSDDLKEKLARADLTLAYKVEINVPNNAF